MTNFNQYYCKLLLRISLQCLVFHCCCNCFCQCKGYRWCSDYCGMQMGLLKASHLFCGSGGGGSSHCGIGPQVISPQLMSLSTGESSKSVWSLVALLSAILRSCLSILMQARSSLRNSMIVSRSLWLAVVVCGGRDVVAGYRVCD